MPKNHTKHTVLTLAVVLSCVAAHPASLLAGTLAQSGSGASQQPSASEQQELHLQSGHSLVISSPTRIKRLSLADPAIAEAMVVSPNQILITGKAPGAVSLILWDESEQNQVFEVSVEIDVLALSDKIHEVFPAEPVRIEASKDMVIVSGQVSSSAVADKILEVVKSSNPKVANFLQVPAPPVAPNGEILLQVKFAEVDRTAANQLGINLLSLPGSKTAGSITTQQFAPAQLTGGSVGGTTTFGLSDLLNIFIDRPDINLAATIKALQANNLLQILAEPNLLTASGKDASFLAGGEFPFPILQSSGGAGFAGVTIQFKEFGVRLAFTPTLLPDGRIHLKVQPEVSSLDFANALTIQGFLIPALSTSRVQSEMDLADGQSFAIAGLMDNRVTEQLSKVPGIGDIPVLGKFFQSRSLTKSNKELLIVVTPVIVKPSTQQPAGPQFPKPFLDTNTPEKPVK